MRATRTGHVPATFALIAASAFLLVGCAAPSEEPGPTPDDTPSAEPEPAPSSAPPATEAVFRMPERCAELLPASRVADLASRGMELLAGPDGKYGDSYFADPTPEQLAGGITCLWGQEDVPENSVIVSVAPLAAGTRGVVIEDLVEQGLNERVDGEDLVYERTGDDVAAPAIVNIVGDDSWISVIEGAGGQENYEEAVEIGDEVMEQVGA